LSSGGSSAKIVGVQPYPRKSVDVPLVECMWTGPIIFEKGCQCCGDVKSALVGLSLR